MYKKSCSTGRNTMIYNVVVNPLDLLATYFGIKYQQYRYSLFFGFLPLKVSYFT